MQGKPQKDVNFMDQTMKATNFTGMNGRDHRISPDSLTQTTDASTAQETTQPVIVQQDTSIRHLPLATLPVVQVFTTVSQISIFPHHQTHHHPKIHNKVNLQWKEACEKEEKKEMQHRNRVNKSFEKIPRFNGINATDGSQMKHYRHTIQGTQPTLVLHIQNWIWTTP